jgi:hypothetical protein
MGCGGEDDEKNGIRPIVNDLSIFTTACVNLTESCDRDSDI